MEEYFTENAIYSLIHVISESEETKSESLKDNI